jgi:fumarate hydratase class I
LLHDDINHGFRRANATCRNQRKGALSFLCAPVFIHDLVHEGAIYHCGPIVKATGNNFKTISAGPTTSIREEPYEHLIIEHYGVRIIIGKGGMGATTLTSLKRHGAVYIHTTGGTASLIAKNIVKTKNVHLLDELGGPEALWEFEVEDFRGVVTMDSTGGSLHEIIEEKSKKNLARLVSS